jgi:hypothetical protein
MPHDVLSFAPLEESHHHRTIARQADAQRKEALFQQSAIFRDPSAKSRTKKAPHHPEGQHGAKLNVKIRV